MVLICDYSSGFIFPEMVKKRPVIVISRRKKNNMQLCTVVPLSATKPMNIEKYHHKLKDYSLPQSLRSKETWVKCDMIATVSLQRLDRVLAGKSETGKRLYVSHKISTQDLQAILTCIIHWLGLADLIKSIALCNNYRVPELSGL